VAVAEPPTQLPVISLITKTCSPQFATSGGLITFQKRAALLICYQKPADTRSGTRAGAETYSIRRPAMQLTDDDRKLLTEYIGECFHNPSIAKDSLGYSFALCEKCGANRSGVTFRPFTTPADLHAVYSAMVEKGEWERFLNYCEGKPGSYIYLDDYGHIHIQPQTFAWLFCLACPEQIPERMKMVAEWIRERG